MGFFSSLFAKRDNTQLAKAISEGAFLVDVRTPAEAAASAVPGAVNIPLATLPQQFAQFKNKKSVVCFCRSGNRSSQAQKILEQNGFTNIVNGGTFENVKNAIKNRS